MWMAALKNENSTHQLPRGCRRAGVLDQDLTVAAGKLFAITSLLG
jgi:hypothetical protein